MLSSYNATMSCHSTWIEVIVRCAAHWKNWLYLTYKQNSMTLLGALVFAIYLYALRHFITQINVSNKLSWAPSLLHTFVLNHIFDWKLIFTLLLETLVCRFKTKQFRLSRHLILMNWCQWQERSIWWDFFWWDVILVAPASSLNLQIRLKVFPFSVCSPPRFPERSIATCCQFFSGPFSSRIFLIPSTSLVVGL